MQVGKVGQHYVLALYPSTHGIAYVLFEGPLSLVDWAKVGAKGKVKNEKCVDVVKHLIERYVPDAIVLEDTNRQSSRRTVRIRMLNRAIQSLAGVYGIEVFRFGSKDIRKAFQSMGACTKHERARTIANMLPALSHRLPPARRAWMAEDPRMSLFEAAGLGITYYGREHGA